jgi:predicted transcriptional regulator
MTETLSIRLSAAVKKQLDELARRSKRSKSFLAAEAIEAYVNSESWQLAEIEAGIEELNSGSTVDHDAVTTWLKSWGSSREKKAPR